METLALIRIVRVPIFFHNEAILFTWAAHQVTTVICGFLYPPNVHHFEGGGYRHPPLLVERLRGVHYWRAMLFKILPSFVQIQEQGR